MPTTISKTPAQLAYEQLIEEWSGVYNALNKTPLWRKRLHLDHLLNLAGRGVKCKEEIAAVLEDIASERKANPEAAALEKRHSEIVAEVEIHREALGLRD